MGTSASSNETKAPGTRHGFAHTTSLPPPYQLAIEDTAFHLTVLDERVAREVDHDADAALLPPAWFSVTIAASTKKRYLYLVQKETGTGVVVLLLLFDLAASGQHSQGLRLPPSGGWLRAVVDGAVYVLASDLVLSRKSISAWIGGNEPPATPARPPCT
jgi:hypothetical protein